MRIAVMLKFTGCYIAHPYWPELEKLINIQKESGTKRARSESRRKDSLSQYLKAHDMTDEDYRVLEQRAARPFYTFEDVLGTPDGEHDPGEIVIPAHHLYGAFAQGVSVVSSSLRISSVDNLRTVLKVGDFATGKTKPDGVWDRYVTVKGGTGAKLSNQRALRSNPYIAAFSAEGWLEFSEDMLEEQKIRRFVEFCGRDVGVGASRKMGMGRFAVEQWNHA